MLERFARNAQKLRGIMLAGLPGTDFPRDLLGWVTRRAPNSCNSC